MPGYEGLYEVSDQGQIRSMPHRTPAGMRGGRVLKATPTKTGYQSVALWKDGNEWRTYTHRLVLLAFAGPCPPGHEARHLNGKAADNRLVNLRWATDAVNGQDRVRHGTSTPGSKNPMAKLTEGDVCAIRERYAAGEKQADLAREHGVTADAIGMIVRRARWRHVG